MEINQSQTPPESQIKRNLLIEVINGDAFERHQRKWVDCMPEYGQIVVKVETST